MKLRSDNADYELIKYMQVIKMWNDASDNANYEHIKYVQVIKMRNKISDMLNYEPGNMQVWKLWSNANYNAKLSSDIMNLDACKWKNCKGILYNWHYASDSGILSFLMCSCDILCCEKSFVMATM